MKQKLNGCGVMVVNPPFTLDKELSEYLPWLARTNSNHFSEYSIENRCDIHQYLSSKN
jgi:23S rRNA A2030 N6-methylase RlmJ